MFQPEDCTPEKIREIDRKALEEFSIPGLILMEHASIGIAERAIDLLGSATSTDPSWRVTILCGPGGNGGDGFAVARHLHGAGWDVTIHDLAPDSGHADRQTNRKICMALGMTPIESIPDADPATPSDLIIDALLGSGTDRAPRHPIDRAIEWINRQSLTVLSIDLPSGLVASNGEVPGVVVQASLTVTLCIPHLGLLEGEGPGHAGQLWICPIGDPAALLPPDAPVFPPRPSPLPANPISLEQ